MTSSQQTGLRVVSGEFFKNDKRAESSYYVSVILFGPFRVSQKDFIVEFDRKRQRFTWTETSASGKGRVFLERSRNAANAIVMEIDHVLDVPEPVTGLDSCIGLISGWMFYGKRNNGKSMLRDLLETYLD